MKNTDIKEVKWNSNEVVALYKGHNLIYSKKQNEPDEPVYGVNTLAGSFTEPGQFTINTGTGTVNIIVDNSLRFCQDVGELTGWCNKMFYKEKRLKTITSFPDLSNAVYDLTFMFASCSNLTSINIRITPNIADVACMFNNDSLLTTLNLSDSDFSGIYSTTNMFGNCFALKTVTGTISGISQSLDLHWSPLTYDSQMVFLNGLAEVNETKTITLNDNNHLYNAEDILMVVDKGWTIAYA